MTCGALSWILENEVERGSVTRDTKILRKYIILCMKMVTRKEK
jgi:hypothetical protein